MFCAKCRRDLEDSIPAEEWDEDETPDEIGVSVSQEVVAGGRTLTVGGVLCSDCMRRGAKLPVPESLLEEEEERDKAKSMAERHAAKAMRSLFDLVERDEIEREEEAINSILGEVPPVHIGVEDDVILADDAEESL